MMHRLTCTSQLVHYLLVCMVIIAKLGAARKVPAFSPSGKFGSPPHGHQVYETLRERLRPCEQKQNQLRSALPEGDKDLLMEDWFAHIRPTRCAYLFYNT